MRGMCICLLVGVVVAAAGWAADAPLAVSPGDATKLVMVEDRCPTFSWGGAEGARSYELVVYRVGEEGDEAQPVLRQSITGSALGWTPSLDRCLKRGGRYAWSVRAVARKGASEWSAPSLFEVAAGPSEVEFEAAMAVVQRYLEAGDGEASSSGAVAEARAGTEPEAGTEELSPAPAAVGTTQLSVDGSVVATSFTGDGSTLTSLDPANLSGVVAVARGGTGGSTAGDARTNLGAAAATHPHTESDVTDLTHTTDTVLTEGQVETFVTNGPLNGSGFTNLDGSNVSTGTVAEARIADEIARDGELGHLARCLDGNVGGWRYWDLGDGTVLDCNTGMIWLKDASCLGLDTWDGTGGTSIFTKVADLNTGTDFGCSGYMAGTYADWEVPAMTDLCGLWISGCQGSSCCTAFEGIVDSRFLGPAVANAAGDGQWSPEDAFVGVQSHVYWSATELDVNFTWVVDLLTGNASFGTPSSLYWVLPVRNPP